MVGRDDISRVYALRRRYERREGIEIFRWPAMFNKFYRSIVFHGTANNNVLTISIIKGRTHVGEHNENGINFRVQPEINC